MRVRVCTLSEIPAFRGFVGRGDVTLQVHCSHGYDFRSRAFPDGWLAYSVSQLPALCDASLYLTLIALFRSALNR